MTNAYCDDPEHEHDASCIPPANPQDNDLRLLRAVYGLCPDCNKAGTHTHETAVARRPQRSVTRQLQVSDKAWMAAVIDLKGAVIKKNNKTRRTPQLVLYVSTKDARVAVRLSALTGTAPEQHAAPTAEEFVRRNCSEHCPSPHVHVGEDYPWRMPQVTRWSLTGIAAAVVLMNLAPYMSTYEDYREVVTQITDTFAASGHGSGAVRATVARLEQLGWKIPAKVEHKMAPGRVASAPGRVAS